MRSNQMILTHSSSLSNDFSINKYFVKNIVDTSKSKVIGSTHSEGLKFWEISVPEEPSSLGQDSEMGESCCSVKEVVIVANYAI